MSCILVVDDSQFQRRFIKGILKEEGHETLEATNGKNCLDIAAKDNPDLILLDLVIQELNGFEVLESLKNNNFPNPVIVISADIQKSSRQLCLDLGARAFLNKPVDNEELRSTVQAVLNGAEGGEA